MSVTALETEKGNRLPSFSLQGANALRRFFGILVLSVSGLFLFESIFLIGDVAVRYDLFKSTVLFFFFGGGSFALFLYSRHLFRPVRSLKFSGIYLIVVGGVTALASLGAVNKMVFPKADLPAAQLDRYMGEGVGLFLGGFVCTVIGIMLALRARSSRPSIDSNNLVTLSSVDRGMNSESNVMFPTMSDDQVREYVLNHRLYSAESVNLAIAELSKRGNPIPDEQVASIKDYMDRRDRIREIGSDKTYRSYNWKANIVTDESAPLLYSRRALYTVNVLGSPFFGSILLSMNLKRLGQNSPIYFAIGFGIAYYLITIILLSDFVSATALNVMLMNMLGSFILDYYFWGKYIGNTKYRTRPSWIPIVVVVLINVLYLLSMLKK